MAYLSRIWVPSDTSGPDTPLNRVLPKSLILDVATASIIARIDLGPNSNNFPTGSIIPTRHICTQALDLPTGKPLEAFRANNEWIRPALLTRPCRLDRWQGIVDV